MAFVSVHPYAAIFLIALAARVVVSVGVFVAFGGDLFLDDATYSNLAAERAAGETSGWNEYDHFLYRRSGALLVPLTGLYALLGPSRIAGQLLVAVVGAGVAVATARLAREVVGPRGSLAAGLIVALLPSQVLFSSVIMKDALVWLLLVTLAIVVAVGGRTRPSRLWACAMAAAVLLLAVGFLRLHTQVVAAWALLLSGWVGTTNGRMLRAFGAVVIAVSVPLLTGTGPAGLGLVADVGSLTGWRDYHARGGSAIAAADATAEPETLRPQEPQEPQETARTPPPPASDEDGVMRNVAYLPAGLAVMLFEPVPWRTAPSAAFRLAQFEMLLWYPLLGLAVVGVRCLWSSRRVLLFPILAGGASAVMWALVEGNVGTAFRHRGEFVWVVVVFAVVGADSLRSRRPGVGYTSCTSPLTGNMETPYEDLSEGPSPARASDRTGAR